MDNSEEEKCFKDIMMSGKLLKNCSLELSGEHGNRRLYVEKGVDSFAAHAVEFVSCVPVDNTDTWDNKSLVVSTIFEVKAYSDGVRHLGFNRNGGEMDGYLYYPGINDLVLMLQKIREIELSICPNVDKT